MAEAVETTGKTVEAALEAALKKLGKTVNEVEYEVIEQPSRGFLGFIGTKPARLRVKVKADNTEALGAAAPATNEVKQNEQEVAALADVQQAEQVEKAEEFLKAVFAAMKLTVTLQRSESAEGTVFNLAGEKLGILIGKHGQTLDSLQYLANLAANRGMTDNRARIIIDIEGYRSRREETLMRLAQHLAEKACRIGSEVHLEPMNRHERKIIHMTLQDNRRVMTYSAGDEPRRYVVIAPKRRRRAAFRRNNETEISE